MTSSPFFSPCDLSSRHFEQKGERGIKEKNAGNRSHSAISKRESRPIRNKTAHNASPAQPNPHRFLSPLIERPSLPVLFSCRWHRLRLFSGSETGGKQKRKEKGEVVVGQFSETIKWCLDLLLLLLFSLPLLSPKSGSQRPTQLLSLLLLLLLFPFSQSEEKGAFQFPPTVQRFAKFGPLLPPPFLCGSLSKRGGEEEREGMALGSSGGGGGI